MNWHVHPWPDLKISEDPLEGGGCYTNKKQTLKPFVCPWDIYVQLTPIIQCSVYVIVYLILNYY